MTRNLFVYPYKMGSRSASALAAALGRPQIRHERSKFKGAKFKTVINWGASELPNTVLQCKVLNKLAEVRVAGNKLEFFRHQTNFPEETRARLVPWTSDKKEALTWQAKGSTIVVRNSLTGHSGHGIEIIEPGQVIPTAPLYTKYIPKESEWRVHIVRGEIIDVQRKVRNPDQEPTNWKVRSHDNGFIYIRNTSEPLPDILSQALRAFNASGLDFCAADVICTKKGTAYVLELNCAPGLEGSTVELYEQAFRKLTT